MANNNNQDNKLVFRLQDENVQNLGLKRGEHWFISNQYLDDQIKAIPSGNSASLDEPTSIPSPFARIALAKTAFGSVADDFQQIIANKDANTPILAAYQKIVSDCLDVAQIFFNYDTLKDKVEIIAWDKDKNLKEMKAKNRQDKLGKTLDTFLNSAGDKRDYHFDKIENIYLLRYKGAGASVEPKLDIIGATSPSTLFFSSGNKFPYVSRNIQFDNHKVFDEKPLHLYQRDIQFFAYLKQYCDSVRAAFGSDVLKEFYDYLTENIDQLPQKQRNQLLIVLPTKSITNTKESHTDIFAIKDNQNNRCVYEFKQKPDGYQWTDFLENSLIKLPYKLANGFFDGNLNAANADEIKNCSFLLPLTTRFFDFFSVNDLKTEKMISIFVCGKIVEVTLRIPNSTGVYIEHKKKYGSTDIIENDFVFALSPNIKFLREEDCINTFWLRPRKTKEYFVDFYNKNSKVSPDSESDLFPFKRDDEYIAKTYPVERLFDNIRISYKENDKNVSGMVVPNFYEQKMGTETFIFAVDFGTTNTHIEYSKGDVPQEVPFDIQEAEKQIHLSYNGDENINLIADFDFIPQNVGGDSIFKFPTRTALAGAKKTDWNKELKPLVQINLALPYEKRGVPKYNRIYTQLKWNSDIDRSRYYIYSLCYIIRNKVILNNGKLADTKVVWFYPVSMSGVRSKDIKDIWTRAYAKYFLGVDYEKCTDQEERNEIDKKLEENLISYTESIAPYMYYKEHSDYSNKISDVVSIDVGGGTTDIVIVQGKKVEFVTSFRFAANAIFGTSQGGIGGIVKQYQSHFENIIVNNDDNYKLENLLNSIKEDENSDMASFFFSLAQNEMLNDVSRDKIDFNAMLRKDEKQKLIFVLFYAAIIYHLAKIMKEKGKNMPRHITFSGNGSRIIPIIAEGNVLEDFTRLIIGKVYGKPYDKSGLDIIYNSVNPKEVTCKGGIKIAKKDEKRPHYEKVVLLGIDDKTFADNKKYSEVNSAYKKQTIAEVKSFIKKVLNEWLEEKTNTGEIEETFMQALRISPSALDFAKEECLKDRDLETFFTNALARKEQEIREMDSSGEIEESFFFYPLSGLLQSLSLKLCEVNNHIK
jgi:hypothetical protein